MRLFERDLRADSSTVPAWLPTRMTQASNFSVAKRWALSEVMETLSMPNWRKHSESRVLDDSCRSTSAARAENFLAEEVRGTREFPNGFSVRDRVWGGRRRPPIFTMTPWQSSGAFSSRSAKTLFWRGKPATATTNKDNAGYKGVITRGDQKHVRSNA